jgi:hypothetical protein
MPNHLLKRLKELRIHSPIPQITGTLLEAWGERIRVLGGVEAEDIAIGVRPVEAEVIAEAVTELGVRRVARVLPDQRFAEAGPDEKVDDEGMGDAFLGWTWAEPGGDGVEVFFGGACSVLDFVNIDFNTFE